MTTEHSSPLHTTGRIAILGLGETGLSAAQWCLDQGAALRLLDTRAHIDILGQLQGDTDQVEQLLGEQALCFEALHGVSAVVISPGLSPIDPAIAQFLAWARDLQIEVISEIELFARALQQLRSQGYTPHVLAVTGTNGKTTVVSLLAHVLRAAGLHVCIAGNISPAALTALRQQIQTDNLPQVWILELSSFQLETTYSLHCDAGAVLNLTDDHLDWHGSSQAYAQAKAKLFALSKVQVFNRDDEQVVAMLPDVNAACTRGFSAHAPSYVGDLGLGLEGGMEWLLAAEATDFSEQESTVRKRQAGTAEPTIRPLGRVNKLMPVEALQLKGRHNALNALAVLALARVLGLRWSDVLHALRTYQGEPHRLELVRLLQGVSYFDDSKGTNVGATVAALNGLDQPLILIAGGLGKGQNFAPLAAAVQGKVKAVFLIGQDAHLIEAALADTGIPIVHQASLEQAVRSAADIAQAGDAVILSPACASMDMFRNYQHRGQVFVEALTELALDQGEAA